VSRLAEIAERYAAMTGAIEALAERKSQLIAETRVPSFSRQGVARTAVLNDIHNIDDFLSRHRDVGAVLKAQVEQAQRDSSAKNVRAALREMIERLEYDVDRLSLVARTQDPQELGDSLLTISLVDRRGERQEAVQKIAEMYRAMATRLRMSADVLGEFHAGKEDRAYLLVSGLGAYGLFKQERGLHRFDRRYKQRGTRSSRETILEDRELVRVEVVHAPQESGDEFKKQVKVGVTALKPARKRLIKAELAVKVFHETSLRSIEVWAARPRDVAVARALSVLSACVAGSESSENDGMVREYDLGIGPRVKDIRTGRVTTRVNDVLKGNVDTS
jgi:hypothetical protein